MLLLPHKNHVQELLVDLCVAQATIMTDPGTADRTYIGPMTPELVEEILAKARFSICITCKS